MLPGETGNILRITNDENRLWKCGKEASQLARVARLQPLRARALGLVEAALQLERDRTARP